jgi:plasmid stabilization system protein ParE
MVIWADPAKADLRAIHDIIASDSKYYAKKVVQDIMGEIGGHDAASCPPIPARGSPSYRATRFQYRVIYFQFTLILSLSKDSKRMSPDSQGCAF